MPPVTPYLSSINSGEFSPRMEGRNDFDRYPNAAKLARNFTLFPQGGMTRRPGTRFVKEVKDSSVATRLIPFEFSESDSYQIEAGNAYFRFYRRQGQILVADTDAAVTNGTFASNITGWTSASTGSGAIAHDSTNQRLQLTGASGSIAWAYQAITIDAGNTAKIHVLRFTVAGEGEVGFQVGTTSTGSTILSETLLRQGYHSISFTPGATTFYIQFRNSNAIIQNMFIDDVSFLDDAAMELTSPYSTSDLTDLSYYQSADVVYICHPDHPPRRMERRADRSWSIVRAFFEDGPYLSLHNGENLAPLQLISNGLFENGLTGWTDSSTGDGFVVFNEAGKFAELDPGTSSGSGNSILRKTATVVDAKQLIVHVLVLAGGGVGISLGTSAGGSQILSAVQQPGWETYEVTTSGTTLHLQFNFNTYAKGRVGVGAVLAYSQDAKLIEPSGVIGTVNLTATGFAPFTSADVGRLIRLEWPGREPGYVVVTGYTSSTVVTVLVLRTLATNVPTESWRFGAWGGDQGFPKVVSFHDGRLVAANTEENPSGIWFSQSAQPENMRPDSFVEGATTVEDDDAISITLRSNKINPIFWMSSQRQLMVGTAGGAWVVKSNGAVVTPSDISAKQHVAVPCADMKSVEVNQNVLFSDKSQRQVYDLGFSLEQDSFIANDLTILSDHLFRSNIVEMVYQRSPHSIVWCRRADGHLCALSFNKQHQVLGWSQAIIGGVFGTGDAIVESISIIPGAEDADQVYNSDERNELWMIVKRTINGSTKRYIEFMEYYFDGPLREDYDTEEEWRDAVLELQEDAFYVDSGLTYDGSSSTTITGLSHLEGQTLKVLSDGNVHPDCTVAGGLITLRRAATKVHAGLSYRHRYESLKITATPENINKIKIIKKLGLLLLDSTGFDFSTVDYDENGRRQHDLYPVNFRRDSDDPNAAIPLYTGETLKATEGVFSSDARIYIEGDEPLPFTVLGLAPQMEIKNV